MKDTVKNYIEIIAKDFQLNDTHSGFLGFINIDPSDSGEYTEVSTELAKNWRKYETLLEEYGLYFESEPWGDEMIICKMLYKLDEDSANPVGTSLQGYLRGYSYSQLIEAFGKPTYNEPSGDDKVQFEWVFNFKGKTFTLYDWKTYDREYSMNELDTWNIGGKSWYGDFHDALVKKLQK